MLTIALNTFTLLGHANANKSACHDCYGTKTNTGETKCSDKKQCTKKCCDNKSKQTATQRRRRRRKKIRVAKNQSQPKKENTKISTLGYEQLKKEKEKLITKGYKENAIKYIEKMVPLCTDLGELAELMLELADLMFDLGRLVKAERLYKEFVHLYPGDNKAEYASYKGILCAYWKTLDSRRDQSKTKETIEMANSFLTRKEVFQTYTNQVTEILVACQEKLLESEINIFQFYLKRGDFLAAQTRLASIEKEFLTLLPNKEPLLITLACDLAEKQDNKQVLEEKQTLLATKFPNYEQLHVIVATAKKKKSYVDKF